MMYKIGILLGTVYKKEKTEVYLCLTQVLLII